MMQSRQKGKVRKGRGTPEGRRGRNHERTKRQKQRTSQQKRRAASGHAKNDPQIQHGEGCHPLEEMAWQQLRQRHADAQTQQPATPYGQTCEDPVSICCQCDSDEVHVFIDRTGQWRCGHETPRKPTHLPQSLLEQIIVECSGHDGAMGAGQALEKMRAILPLLPSQQS